jgi:hypothetical protein
MLLVNNNQSLELPDDLEWSDEFNWSPNVIKQEFLITGKLLISSGIKTGGRPITLVSPNNGGWITRENLITLYSWASVNSELVLTLPDNREFNVTFDNNPITAKLVIFYNVLQETDYYTITLKLITLAE